VISGLLAALALLAQAAPPPDPEPAPWHGGFAVRGDAVRDIPDPTQQPFERARLRLTHGYERAWFGARVLAAVGTDHNRDVLRRFENARADEVVLDRLWIRRSWREGGIDLTAGKFGVPLRTTGLLWDPKLQAQGAAVTASLSGPPWTSALHARAMVSLRTHLHPDRSRIAAGQVDAELTTGDRVALGLFAFDRLEQAPLRTNRPASQFRVVSLLGRGERVLGDLVLEATAHLVHNLAVDRARQGGELRLSLGDPLRGWTARYVGQRVQRDALPAAFSDDVWWFHTAHRGHLAAFALTRRGVTCELGGLVQRRDDLKDRLSRAFLEMRGTW
jgi:hypothetical protein